MKNSSAYALPVRTTGQHTLPSIPVSARITWPDTGRIASALQKLTGAVALSSISAWCVTSALALLFESGYLSVLEFAGQPDSSQAVIAGMMLWFIVMPSGFALTIAYLEQSLRGPQYWSLMPGFAVSCGSAFLLAVDNAPEALLELAPWITIALFSAYTSYLAGLRIVRIASKHSLQHVLASGIIACLPVGILSLCDISLSYRLQTLLCAGIFLCAAAWASKTCTTKTDADLPMSITIALLPLLTPLIFNVVASLISCLADSIGLGLDLGWRAAVSAMGLLIFALVNCATGCCLGRWLD